MSSEADLPRSIRRGPPITIVCECGERRDLHYGEHWTCEKCSLTWNTRRIPREEYERLRRTQLRYRRLPLAMAAVVAAVFVLLILGGNTFGGVVLVALAAVVWSRFGQPRWHRRYADATANPPTWTIEPE